MSYYYYYYYHHHQYCYEPCRGTLEYRPKSIEECAISGHYDSDLRCLNID